MAPRRTRAPVRHQPWGVRPLGHAVVHEQDAASGWGGSGQPAQDAVPRTGVPDLGLVDDVQGHLGRDRLAGRRSAVRFECVPVPAIAIGAGGQRVPEWLGCAAVEQPSSAPARWSMTRAFVAEKLDRRRRRRESRWPPSPRHRRRGRREPAAAIAGGIPGGTGIAAVYWDGRHCPCWGSVLACLWSSLSQANPTSGARSGPAVRVQRPIRRQGRRRVRGRPGHGPGADSNAHGHGAGQQAVPELGLRRQRLGEHRQLASPRARRPGRSAARSGPGAASGPGSRPGGGPADPAGRSAGRRRARPTGPCCGPARLLAGPAAHAEDVAAAVGLSPRQLRRRTEAAVGYGPKLLQRVLRFRRFVSAHRRHGRRRRIWPRPPSTSGYADQPHLTRESVQLAGLPPAALIRARHPRTS